MTNEWALDPLPILRNARMQLVDVSAIAGPLAVAAPDVATTTQATPEMSEQAISGGLRTPSTNTALPILGALCSCCDTCNQSMVKRK
jgi:hypothetical protein